MEEGNQGERRDGAGWRDEETKRRRDEEEGGDRGDVVIELDRVTFAYAGSREPAVQDVSLRVGSGERLGILGPNAGGKTTLIKLLLGLLVPGSGAIKVCGMNPKDARKRGLIGYVPQRSEAELAFPLDARQVVAMGTANKIDKHVSEERTAEAIEVTGLTDVAHAPIGTLSGGQLQRVLIARALAAAPKILIMDEPTVGVDLAGQVQFGELLRTARERFGLTIVIVSHDVKAIAATCDHVACLSRTLHSHTAPDGLTPEVLAEVFQHDVASVFGDVHVHAHLAHDCNDPSHGPHDAPHTPHAEKDEQSETGGDRADA